MVNFFSLFVVVVVVVFGFMMLVTLVVECS